jgi:putative ABC transport system permease protein
MIRNYFKMAWRNLMKNKISSVINISGLAVGLATGIIILLVIVDELSYDKFHANLKDIYLVMKNDKTENDVFTADVTPGQLAQTLRDELPDIKYAVRTSQGGTQLLRVGDKSLYEQGIYAEPDFFNMMSFQAIEGDPVAALKESGSIVITQRTAKKFFGDEYPIGKMIVHDNLHNMKVAAVIKDVPQNSTTKFDIVLPFTLFEQENKWLKKWDDNRIITWLQLKPSVNRATLNEKLNNVFVKQPGIKNAEIFAYPLAKLNLYGRFRHGKPSGGLIELVMMLSITAAFVLLIACINFMNLATARSERRAREVGVRKVMGASRKMIIVQFLSEALLLSALALLLGAGLAKLALPGFLQVSGKQFTPDFTNWQIWALLIGLGLITGLVAGSYPAFYLSRFQPVIVLKKLMRTSEKGGGLLRKILVTFQFVISIFLVITSMVIFKQINYIKSLPIGYNAENLVEIPARGDMSQKYEVFKNIVSRIPGVQQVTASSDDMVGFGAGVNDLNWPGRQPGQDIFFTVSYVQHDWLKTMGIKIAEGRDFSRDFGTDTAACLINETAVKQLGMKGSVVGMKLGGNTIIGVIENFVYNNPTSEPKPMIIFLSNQAASHFFVRFVNDDKWQDRMAEVEKAVKAINPNYPFEFHFTKEEYERNFKNIRSSAFMINAFGCMAIFIACLGLFGLSAFLAERRSKEISIRKVLGAGVRRIWFSLSKEFLKPVVIAFSIAAPIAWWVMDMMLSRMDYHTDLSWWIFAIAGVGAVVVAIGTVSFHGIKAATENPVKSLGTE